MEIYRTNKKGQKSKITLSAAERRKAYEEQQHIYDKDDIRNRLDTDFEYYVEKFRIDEARVTGEEVERMAQVLRKMLDNDADSSWSECVHEAIVDVLRKRKVAQ